MIRTSTLRRTALPLTKALHLAREHLQRLALDLPALAPAGQPPGRAGLRHAPVIALTAPTSGPGEQAQHDHPAAQLAGAARPAFGALTLGRGEGIAWSEMSHGLLVHWVRLQAGETDPATAPAERDHVLAPTEWNFHPDGALSRAIGEQADRHAAHRSGRGGARPPPGIQDRARGATCMR